MKECFSHSGNVYVGLQVIRMLYRWIPIAIFSYLFSMFFVPRYTPFADRARSHAMFTMCDGNHQWRNVNPMSKKWIGSATRLESRLVTWCLWTNGRIGCKNSWWTNQEELLCPLSRKTRRVQWLFYFNALSLPNHVCM